MADELPVSEFPTLKDIQDDPRYEDASDDEKEVFVAKWFRLAGQEGRRQFGKSFKMGTVIERRPIGLPIDLDLLVEGAVIVHEDHGVDVPAHRGFKLT